MDINDDGPDGWVDKLMESARESTRATADGLTEMAGDVACVGGAVAKLADAVTRMAATCERTQTHAVDAKHTVTAADWFWRQVKSALVGHKKAVAGGAAAIWFGFGSPAVPQSASVSASVSPIGVAVHVERLLDAGRAADAEAVIGGRWKELGEADGYWMLARAKKLQGKNLAAAVLFRKAADAGHPDAAKVIAFRKG